MEPQRWGTHGSQRAHFRYFFSRFPSRSLFHFFTFSLFHFFTLSLLTLHFSLFTLHFSPPTCSKSHSAQNSPLFCPYFQQSNQHRRFFICSESVFFTPTSAKYGEVSV